ncbi:MAG: tetratricopeptide repeat protein [Polaromonas sp.]|nr:tetratricopeptide repeat protein [Polaromonas sp.]
MHSKKRKRLKAPPRKTAGLQRQEAPASPLSLLANPSDLRGLEIFLTQTRGFRLALALHDDMRVRDQINRYLQEKLQASGVDLLLVDLRTESAETSLLGSAATAFAAHSAKPGLTDGRAALTLVNLESRVNYNPELCNREEQKSAYLATANLQRDLWPATFDGPVLIWMSELLEPAMAKWAPDLWHWRSHVFDLRKTQSEKVLDALVCGKESDLNLSDDTQAGVAQRLAQWQTQLDAYRKAGKRGDEAKILGAIGQERLKLGQASIAKQNFEASLAIAREVGDRRTEGMSLESLGSAFYALGQICLAKICYQQALAIAREIGHKHDESACLGNLANACAALGEIQLAIYSYEQAVKISQKTGDKNVEGQILGNFGRFWTDLGENRHAMLFYEQALSIARQVGNKHAEGSHLGNLGCAWFNLGESRRAIEFHEQSLAIACAIGNKRSEAFNVGAMSIVCASLGEHNRAFEFCEQAVSIFRGIGDKRGESSSLFNLALTLKERGAVTERQRAVDLMKEALVIFNAIESPSINTAKAILDKWQVEK